MELSYINNRLPRFMTILDTLAVPDARRSKSARKVAACVLANPAAVPGMSIAQLALAAGVSEPSVIRFCTGLGLRGFPDFKVRLAADLARESPGVTRDIHPGDTLPEVVAKIFDAARHSLLATRRDLDTAALAVAIERLGAARAILVCGQGASASVALDAQHKLMVLGTPVIAHTDVVQQRMAAAALAPEDCLLCISYTGRTIAMQELATLAGARGASVVGLTAPGSPLAAACAVVLGVAANEDTDVHMPMSSRIAQLAVIDVLVAGLALRLGPGFGTRLRTLKQQVIATRSAPADASGSTQGTPS
jgi:RpiR family transcriptional regulator, carbohydrate utilization regulator